MTGPQWEATAHFSEGRTILNTPSNPKLDFLGSCPWLADFAVPLCFPLSFSHFFTSEEPVPKHVFMSKMIQIKSFSEQHCFELAKYFVQNRSDRVASSRGADKLEMAAGRARCLNSSFISGRNTLQDILKCGNTQPKSNLLAVFIQAVT